MNTESKEVVAIKKCLRIFDRKLITKRCLRELKLLQHFNGHPHIVGLLDMDIVDYQCFNELYLVLECCDTTMHDIIHSNVPLEPVHYRWFMYQMFSALHYIHSANVLHRDLKPSNILVNQNCTLRICDFGMARGFSNSKAIENPLMTHYVVTRWYRAPEIMLSNSSYDKAIDMWSAGCIFAELLERKVLFKGNDYVDQLKKIIGILGLPKDTSFWDETTSDSVIDYIRNLRDADGNPPPTDPIDFTAFFPNCPPEGIDLLESLLQLNSKKRLTAEMALSHPYVHDMRDPGEEIGCPVEFDFESFENIDNQDELRICIVNEVKSFKDRDDSDLDDDINDEDDYMDEDEYSDMNDNDSTIAIRKGMSHDIIVEEDNNDQQQINNNRSASTHLSVDNNNNNNNINNITAKRALSHSSNYKRTYSNSSRNSRNNTALSTPSTVSMLTPNVYKRRYTGSISTPISASATEAHLNALAAVQQGRDVPVIPESANNNNNNNNNNSNNNNSNNNGMIMGEDIIFVGEPEDMDEEDRQGMYTDESIQIDYHRRLIDPLNTDRQEIERQLSRDWY
ncbi:unnamed protein product [Cunninghamella blakesleeana]